MHPDTEKSDAGKAGRAGISAAVRAIIFDRNWIVMTLSLVIIFFGNSMMMTSGTCYALYRMNDLGQFSWMMSAQLIPRIFIQFLMPFVMSRIGKKWSFIAGQTLAAVGFNAKAAVQPAAVITAVSWAHIWIPAICFASASIVIALLFDIEK